MPLLPLFSYFFERYTYYVAFLSLPMLRRQLQDHDLRHVAPGFFLQLLLRPSPPCANVMPTFGSDSSYSALSSFFSLMSAVLPPSNRSQIYLNAVRLPPFFRRCVPFPCFRHLKHPESPFIKISPSFFLFPFSQVSPSHPPSEKRFFDVVPVTFADRPHPAATSHFRDLFVQIFVKILAFFLQASFFCSVAQWGFPPPSIRFCSLF